MGQQVSSNAGWYEVVTSGLAGGSHLRHRNVEWGLFRRLDPAAIKPHTAFHWWPKPNQPT